MKICPVCNKQYPDSDHFCPDDGASLVPMQGGSLTQGGAAHSGDPMMGRKMFGSYIISKKLGEGGMGVVWKAVNNAKSDSFVMIQSGDQDLSQDRFAMLLDWPPGLARQR